MVNTKREVLGFRLALGLSQLLSKPFPRNRHLNPHGRPFCWAHYFLGLNTEGRYITGRSANLGYLNTLDRMGRSHEQKEVPKSFSAYEFLCTSIDYAIAAFWAHNSFAALASLVFLGPGLANFCSVVVLYTQIQPFWRYWMYYLNLFTYLIGGLFEHVVWHVKIDCRSEELTHIPLPNSNSTTYGDYIANFIRDKVMPTTLTN
ncbi:unnamed protein product [Fusarium graminearum]|nr:unnamed protein product [Fusarium graminearum]